jgi:alginate O-acetyltransferase complex protein AlgI
VAVTFVAVVCGWVFFRATTLTAAGGIFYRLFLPAEGRSSPLSGLSLWALLGVLAIAHVVTARGLWRRWVERLPAPLLGGAYALALNFALLLAPDAGRTFIYFQF